MFVVAVFGVVCSVDNNGCAVVLLQYCSLDFEAIHSYASQILKYFYCTHEAVVKLPDDVINFNWEKLFRGLTRWVIFPIEYERGVQYRYFRKQTGCERFTTNDQIIHPFVCGCEWQENFYYVLIVLLTTNTTEIVMAANNLTPCFCQTCGNSPMEGTFSFKLIKCQEIRSIPLTNVER